MYEHPVAHNAKTFADGQMHWSDPQVGIAMHFREDASVPEWIELVPAGQFTGRDGRTWVNDQPQAVIETFKAQNSKLPFDIEHSSEHKAKRGEPAPAHGWIEELEERDGAIWARVDWNDSGRQLVANRQYRYYSPVFWFTKNESRVVALKSAALTNQPNLHFQALNHAESPSHEENSMSNAISLAIITALGMNQGATEEQVVAAINALQSDRETALNSAQNPDPKAFVPTATHDLAINRAEKAESDLAALQQSLHNDKVEVAINAALEAGKIAPCDKEYFTASCATEEGLAQFNAYIEKTPGVLSDQGSQTEQKPAGAESALNAEEAQVADLMGIAHEDFAKSRDAAAA